jgi:hypothetical protein
MHMEKRKPTKPSEPSKPVKPSEPYDPTLPEVGDAVSAQECTGLIPAIVPTENGTEAYRTLFSTEIPAQKES